MNITFYLPGATNTKSGGYKVIYTYCNLLSNRGNNVTIVYSNHNFRGVRFLHKVKVFRQIFVYLIFGKRPRWFKLNKNVHVLYAFNGEIDKSIPNADIVIATAVDTAEEVLRLPISKGKKCYFVQGHEEWAKGEQYAINSYKLPLNIITISNYLSSIISKYAQKEPVVIKNGIEHDMFYLVNSIRSRDKYTVSMLYHTLEIKGSKYGIEALQLLKEDYPQLCVQIFGTCDRPEDLPAWMRYKKNANYEELNRIYNSSAIFLSPVIKEGFGLTGAESMACGCCLVSSDFDAVHEYAVNNHNCLLSPVKDSYSLYYNMKKCIEEDDLRYRLAENGRNDVKKLNWEDSVNQLSEFLKGLV